MTMRSGGDFGAGRRGLALLTALFFALQGCATRVPTASKPVLQTQEFAEELLLDVGVATFDPGVAPLDTEDAAAAAAAAGKAAPDERPDIRNAEARYMAWLLKQRLGESNSWGAVHVLPRPSHAVEVSATATILNSDGADIALRVEVRDATDRRWFLRDYKISADASNYNSAPGMGNEPFDALYTTIANDMLAYRAKLSEEEVREIRRAAELRFAQEFSPESFEGYLKPRFSGRLGVVRLPAEQDPMFARALSIRDRERLFLNTLDEHYDGFHARMQTPYQVWRQYSYEEIVALRAQRKKSLMAALIGGLLVVGSVVAAGSNSRTGRSVSDIGIVGGALVLKHAYDLRVESNIHAEAIRELSDSFGAEAGSLVVELEDRTVTLTGSVDQQYEEWRRLLREIYLAERAAPEAPEAESQAD